MKCLLAFIYFLVFPLLAVQVLAVSVTLFEVPSIVTNQEFEVSVNVTGASTGTNYLKASFYPLNTINYFGYTYNGNEFMNTSSFNKYLPIIIDSTGSWSGQLLMKIDPDSSFYTGPGEYGLKIRRYTESGSSYTWSNELPINISFPKPTLTPSPTPDPTPAPSSANKATAIFSISTQSESISASQSLLINASLWYSDFSSTKFYLKGAFRKAGETNYFGYTKIGENWIKNGASFNDQLEIITNSSGQWSGEILVKPDPADSGYEGAGEYLFKVAKYSETGTNLIWSNEIKINLTIPVAEPTIKPAASPTPVLKTKTSKAKISDLTEEVATIAGVATAAASEVPVYIVTPKPTPTIKPIVVKGYKTNYLPILGCLFILVGFGSIIYIYRSIK
jgi:hypothetical protein